MADGVINIAKGAFAEKFRDAAAGGEVVLLQAAEADAVLIDYAELQALLAAAGNTEQTTMGRKLTLTGTVTVDTTNDRVDVDIPDQTWTGATGSAVVKLLVCYNQGAGDVNVIPLTHHDFAVTPDGSDITAQFNAAGFARAQ